MIAYTVQYIDRQMKMDNNEMGVFSSEKKALMYIDEELKQGLSKDRTIYFIVTSFEMNKPGIVLKEYKVTNTGEHKSL